MAIKATKPVPYTSHFAKPGKADECLYRELPDQVVGSVWGDKTLDEIKAAKAQIAAGTAVLDGIAQKMAAKLEEKFEVDTSKGHVIVGFRFGKTSWTAAKGVRRVAGERASDPVKNAKLIELLNS